MVTTSVNHAPDKREPSPATRDDQTANCQICGRLTHDGAVCAECGAGA